MFLGSLVLLGSLGVLRVGFRSVVSRPSGVVGALCGVQAWGSYEMSGSGRTVLNVRLRAHGA